MCHMLYTVMLRVKGNGAKAHKDNASMVYMRSHLKWWEPGGSWWRRDILWVLSEYSVITCLLLRL